MGVCVGVGSGVGVQVGVGSGVGVGVQVGVGSGVGVHVGFGSGVGVQVGVGSGVGVSEACAAREGRAASGGGVGSGAAVGETRATSTLGGIVCSPSQPASRARMTAAMASADAPIFMASILTFIRWADSFV